VSVILAVRCSGAVLLCADRAAIDPSRELTPGYAWPLPDRQKLFTSPSGIAFAVAGIGTTPDGTVDLLKLLPPALTGATTAATAATAILDVFEGVAARVRIRPAVEASAIEPFERPVLTVALVAGPSPSGPDAYVVGLTTTGLCIPHRVLEDGLAYGPGNVRADLALAVTDAAAQPSPHEGLARVGAVIESAATKALGLVSLDWDSVTVAPEGTIGVEHHQYPRKVILPPRISPRPWRIDRGSHRSRSPPVPMSLCRSSHPCGWVASAGRFLQGNLCDAAIG